MKENGCVLIIAGPNKCLSQTSPVWPGIQVTKFLNTCFFLFDVICSVIKIIPKFAGCLIFNVYML